VAVLDPMTRTVLDGALFANTAAGYLELRRFARRGRRRSRAIEGCRGAGCSLAQHLVADGERVVDVPAKLAARVRVFSQVHGHKTDRDDAILSGLAPLDAVALQDVHLDDHTVALRLLCDRRAELVALRTQAICRLHRLICRAHSRRCAPRADRRKGHSRADPPATQGEPGASAGTWPWTTCATCAPLTVPSSSRGSVPPRRGSRKIGPWRRSPMARSTARAVRGTNGMVTVLASLVIAEGVDVRSDRLGDPQPIQGQQGHQPNGGAATITPSLCGSDTLTNPRVAGALRSCLRQSGLTKGGEAP
jgi:hypothetical protein